MAAKFEIQSAKAGEFNWVLTSQGRKLASGETYTRKVSAEKAIESLRKAVAGAVVEDKTLRPAKAAAAPAKKAAPAKRTAAKKAAPVKAPAVKKARASKKSAPAS